MNGRPWCKCVVRTIAHPNANSLLVTEGIAAVTLSNGRSHLDDFTSNGWPAIFDLFPWTATGVVNKTLIAWTPSNWTALNSPHLLGLPDEAIQAVPTTVLEWSLSHPEYLQEAPPALPSWEQLWRGFVAVLDEILAQVGAWIWRRIAGAAQAVASAVQAAPKALEQLVDWALDLVAAMVNALLSPFYAGLRDEGFRLTASADVAMSARDPAQRKDFLSSIWDMVGSGNFFNVVLAIVIALQVIAAVAINVILPGSGSVIAKLIETVVMGFVIGFFVSGLTDLLLLGLDAIFKAAVPASDVFWSEGAGLDVIGVILDLSSIILGWEKASKPGIAVFKTLKNLDAAWLALSLAGLSITLASASWSGWPAVAASAIGLGFAFIGALKVMDEDSIDRVPFGIAPLKYSEEAFSLIGLSYAIADFGKTVSEEL